jgi:hypothetical protein
MRWHAEQDQEGGSGGKESWDFSREAVIAGCTEVPLMVPLEVVRRL